MEMSIDGSLLVSINHSLNRSSVKYHCVIRWRHLMVSYYSNHDVTNILSTAKRYNELYPKKKENKKEGKKESKKKEQTETTTTPVESKKKEVDDQQHDEDEDDVPRQPKLKDPYADLPKRYHIHVIFGGGFNLAVALIWWPGKSRQDRQIKCKPFRL